MSEYATVEALFSQLGAWLSKFETDDYLTFTEGEHIPFEYIFDNRVYIKKIALHIYGFKTQDALPVVKNYIERIIEIIPNLQPIKYDKGDNPELGVQSMSVKLGTSIMNLYKEHLEFTLKHLRKFEEKLSKQNPGMSTEPTVIKKENVIVLPDDFTVTQIIQTGFEPRLNRDTATLFLHYLRENGIMPNYNNSSLGKLAEYFFVRNQKYIKDKLSEVYNLTKDKEKLQTIENIFKDILKQIQEDLKTAR